MYTITLTSTVTNEDYIVEMDNINDNYLYYHFRVDTTNIPDGEYRLTLADSEGNIVAADLVRVGNYTPTTNTYNSNKNFRTYNG